MLATVAAKRIGLQDGDSFNTTQVVVDHAGRAQCFPSSRWANIREVQWRCQRIVGRRESFWSAVYEPFMARDLTRADVRFIVSAGLQHTRGNYKMLIEFFNMAPADYKRFLNFLRKHECHMPFQQFRTSESLRAENETHNIAMA